MPDIIDAVDSFCLTSQNRLIHRQSIRSVFGKRQYLVEMMGAKHLSGGKIAANRFGELGKGGRFFGVGRVMDAKNAWLAAGNQAVGRSDIGRNHEIFDQTLRLGLRPLGYGNGFAGFIHNNAAFL